MVRGEGIDTLLIQLQNPNLIVTFQISRPFNKTWDSSVRIRVSLINRAESNSLKDWFSFIRMFSHKSLIFCKSHSASLEKNYFGKCPVKLLLSNM